MGCVINWNYLLKLLVAVLGIFFFCEFLIYYIILLRCAWPQLNDALRDERITLTENYKPLKAMILSDPHLLGPVSGHWFDKLRREWQMHRAFQTVMTIHNPDVVFFLGDIFDEGYWSTTEAFRHYVERFQNLFYTPEKTKVFVAVGNHDIGFHYMISQHLNDRFVQAFQAPSVNLVTLEGNAFVLINSMAMEGDECFLCKPAETKLKEIGRRLQCDLNSSNSCHAIKSVPQHTRPILLQHIPLYRTSEAICTEHDSAPSWEKAIPHREKWECLSRDASFKLLQWLRPRLVIDGHTHHSCQLLHPGGIPEWTVASFSWRNKNNPSFLLATFTPNNYAIFKCPMPEESTVITLYIVGGIGLVVWIIATRRRLLKTSHYTKVS